MFIIIIKSSVYTKTILVAYQIVKIQNFIIAESFTSKSLTLNPSAYNPLIDEMVEFDPKSQWHDIIII